MYTTCSITISLSFSSSIVFLPRAQHLSVCDVINLDGKYWRITSRQVVRFDQRLDALTQTSIRHPSRSCRCSHKQKRISACADILSLMRLVSDIARGALYLNCFLFHWTPTFPRHTCTGDQRHLMYAATGSTNFRLEKEKICRMQAFPFAKHWTN